MKMILASASPRRRELMEQIGLTFEVMTSQIEERVFSEKPGEVVEELSRQKAEAVGKQFCQGEGIGEPAHGEEAAEEDILVVGADTVVAFEGAVLGKPGSAGEAVRMLERLQGREHEVYTGVTLLYRAAGAEQWRVKCFHERTRVCFYPMSDEEIQEYVQTGDPLDKAGAYGIQGFCARYVSGIEGDYHNVVGLPVGRLYQEMKELLGR